LASTATLTNCTISGNTDVTTGLFGSAAGGIYADTATMTNCTVTAPAAMLSGASKA